jgi:hypothetical protein
VWLFQHRGEEQLDKEYLYSTGNAEREALEQAVIQLLGNCRRSEARRSQHLWIGISI